MNTYEFLVLEQKSNWKIKLKKTQIFVACVLPI